MTEAVSWLGRELELEVGAVAHGGHCVSRVDGRVVFVRHALPGERVTATVTEDKGGSFCRADAVTVHEASSGRVEPPCPVAVPGGCGGCDWQHADPALQRELKAAVVEEQLHRLAGIERKVLVEELPGGPLGWRTRVRLVAGRDGRAGLREHRSHRVVPIDDCPITVRGALDGVLSETWRPGSEIEVTRDADSEVHVREQNTWRGRTRSHRISGERPSSAPLGGSGGSTRTGSGRSIPRRPRPSPLLSGNGRTRRATVAWDLYAGVGLFASVLAEQVGPGGRVRAIESGRRAVADGEANLADLPQVKWSSGRVEHVVARAEKPVDVVVLDPPRKGAGREVVDAIAAGEPDRIVYVACDPAALARDLAFFAGHGYGLTELRAFDAFPMTHHVECVALLQ